MNFVLANCQSCYGVRFAGCLQKKGEKEKELRDLEGDVKDEEDRLEKIDADMKRLNDATHRLKNKCAPFS